MIVIPGDKIVYCDIDDTIAMWAPSQEEIEKKGVLITCPGSLIDVDNDGNKQYAPSWTQMIVPHKHHIEKIIKHKTRGHTVVVWSAGGYDWAAAVIRAFKLENYVDVVISKPTWIIDDLPASEFMPKNYWQKDE